MRNIEKEILDFGSGGGLPAIPLKIISGNRFNWVLIESLAKKANFLREVTEHLGLHGLGVVQKKIEVYLKMRPRAAGDFVVTSKALGRCSKIFGFLSAAKIYPSTILLYKGVQWKEEMLELEKMKILFMLVFWEYQWHGEKGRAEFARKRGH